MDQITEVESASVELEAWQPEGVAISEGERSRYANTSRWGASIPRFEKSGYSLIEPTPGRPVSLRPTAAKPTFHQPGTRWAP